MKDILPELNNKDYITKLNEDYDIHFCKECEVEELVEFIDTYWRKGHIFVLSRALLDWQHYDRQNHRYNFVLAKHKGTNEIHSILGFVPTYQFDNDITNAEVWPCIWKSRDDVHVKGLGVSLYYYLKSNIDIETISILGISEIALGIYKHWNFSTGKIDHFYMPNDEIEEYISKNRHYDRNNYSKSDDWSIKYISKNEYDTLDPAAVPFTKISKYKSKQFYVNRYFLHPIYNYEMIAIQKNKTVSSILIVRECKADDRKCLRIVDYIGDVGDLAHITYELRQLMKNKNYEYIDFIIVGVSHETLRKAGFINRKEDESTIIPNYFEPFVRQNVDLDYAFKTVDDTLKPLFFKADADQDRPNMLP